MLFGSFVLFYFTYQSLYAQGQLQLCTPAQSHRSHHRARYSVRTPRGCRTGRDALGGAIAPPVGFQRGCRSGSRPGGDRSCRFARRFSCCPKPQSQRYPPPGTTQQSARRASLKRRTRPYACPCSVSGPGPRVHHCISPPLARGSGTDLRNRRPTECIGLGPELLAGTGGYCHCSPSRHPRYRTSPVREGGVL